MSRYSKRQKKQAPDPGAVVPPVPTAARVVVPSISAAAHCAQSCLRFWNLLLQDAASVNPFGMSTDLGDRTDEEEEEEQPPPEEEAPPSSPPQLQKVKEEDVELPQQDAPLDAETAIVLLPETDTGAVPRSEPFMRPRSIHWWNHHVGFAREDDPKFMHVFQLPLGFFTTVSTLCREDMQQGDIPMSLRHVEGRLMSVERQVAIAVMRLSTGITFRSVSEILGCGRSTVVKIVNKLVASLRQKAPSYLQWPASAEKMSEVKEGFQRKFGLSNCCGALDTTHICMELPTGEPADVWIDHNHNFSMLLQAVVDTDLRFLDVCVGHPGSVTEAKCLRESALYKKCCSGERLNGEPVVAGDLSIGEYVVGDSEYPLLPWLMKPYKSSELTPARAPYNDKLLSTRIVMARAFGRLKGTWRILHGTMKQPNIERLPKMIHAICIMHNICVEFGGVEGVHFPEPEMVIQNDSEGSTTFEDEETPEARQARDNLCTYLNTLEHA